jgi:hypothetical protein
MRKSDFALVSRLKCDERNHLVLFVAHLSHSDMQAVFIFSGFCETFFLFVLISSHGKRERKLRELMRIKSQRIIFVFIRFKEEDRKKGDFC